MLSPRKVGVTGHSSFCVKSRNTVTTSSTTPAFLEGGHVVGASGAHRRGRAAKHSGSHNDNLNLMGFFPGCFVAAAAAAAARWRRFHGGAWRRASVRRGEVVRRANSELRLKRKPFPECESRLMKRRRPCAPPHSAP